VFSPPTLAMGPFLYLTISMTSPPWFSFMDGEMTMAKWLWLSLAWIWCGWWNGGQWNKG
jgi:hypothetical protein